MKKFITSGVNNPLIALDVIATIDGHSSEDSGKKWYIYFGFNVEVFGEGGTSWIFPTKEERDNAYSNLQSYLISINLNSDIII